MELYYSFKNKESSVGIIRNVWRLRKLEETEITSKTKYSA